MIERMRSLPFKEIFEIQKALNGLDDEKRLLEDIMSDYVEASKRSLQAGKCFVCGVGKNKTSIFIKSVDYGDQESDEDETSYVVIVEDKGTESTKEVSGLIEMLELFEQYNMY